VLLAVIASGIFICQYQFNPAVLSLHDVLPVKDQIKLSGDISRNENSVLIPEGTKPMTSPEIFNSTTLYEKINGKAELYLSAGFKLLRSQRFTSLTNSALWMEAFIYEMNSPKGAFAVYSQQRRDNGVPTDISRFSYRTENAFFMMQGPYYVEIVSSKSSEEMTRFMLAFAEGFVEKFPSDSRLIPELSLFPNTCADEGHITMIPSSAFGFEQLDNVFTASCGFEGKEVDIFISQRGTAGNAQKLYKEYRDFLKTIGGVEVGKIDSIKNSILIETFDVYELFFTSDIYFCGVHEAPDRKTAETAALLLFDKIEKASK
jgi:hypothetical protein